MSSFAPVKKAYESYFNSGKWKYAYQKKKKKNSGKWKYI